MCIYTVELSKLNLSYFIILRSKKKDKFLTTYNYKHNFFFVFNQIIIVQLVSYLKTKIENYKMFKAVHKFYIVISIINIVLCSSKYYDLL